MHNQGCYRHELHLKSTFSRAGKPSTEGTYRWMSYLVFFGVALKKKQPDAKSCEEMHGGQ